MFIEFFGPFKIFVVPPIVQSNLLLHKNASVFAPQKSCFCSLMRRLWQIGNSSVKYVQNLSISSELLLYFFEHRGEALFAPHFEGEVPEAFMSCFVATAEFFKGH